jgi:hypothetical protein
MSHDLRDARLAKNIITNTLHVIQTNINASTRQRQPPRLNNNNNDGVTTTTFNINNSEEGWSGWTGTTMP